MLSSVHSIVPLQLPSKICDKYVESCLWSQSDKDRSTRFPHTLAANADESVSK